MNDKPKFRADEEGVDAMRGCLFAFFISMAIWALILMWWFGRTWPL